VAISANESAGATYKDGMLTMGGGMVTLTHLQQSGRLNPASRMAGTAE